MEWPRASCDNSAEVAANEGASFAGTMGTSAQRAYLLNRPGSPDVTVQS